MKLSKKAMIFDLDGTLADVRSIAHYVQGNYGVYGSVTADRIKEYHDKAIDVPVVQYVKHDLCWAHRQEDITIAIATARRAIDFLVNNKIPCDLLFMKEMFEHRSDVKYKLGAVRTLRHAGYEVIRAYEDNPEIATAYEDAGIPTNRVYGFGFDYA